MNRRDFLKFAVGAVTTLRVAGTVSAEWQPRPYSFPGWTPEEWAEILERMPKGPDGFLSHESMMKLYPDGYVKAPKNQIEIADFSWVPEMAEFWEETYGMSLAEANRLGM